MKIITIVGARPQFIKAAMLSREFAKHTQIQEIILHTGQHYDANMSDIFFAELNLPAPKYNLGIHKATHGAMTGAMLEGIEEILIKEKPNMVVVYGDTDSTMAGALAAAKLNIPLAHIEAGLRSFNRNMPEEINRVVTDHISDLLFAPTPTAVKNLQAENRPKGAIRHCGDIMFDAALCACDHVDENALLNVYDLTSNNFSLVTLHRAENTDKPERLLTWFEALNQAGLSEVVMLPLHPRTKHRLALLGKTPANYPSIRFIDPVGYQTMAVLTKNARLVITDSGGLQKEAYFHKTPCLIMRSETEWSELVENGWSRLVSCDQVGFLDAYSTHHAPSEAQDEQPLGNGVTAQTICQQIFQYTK